SDFDLDDDLAHELGAVGAAAGLVGVLGGDDNQVAGQQQHGAAQGGLLVELQVVFGLLFLEDQALALAVAELLLAGDDVLDVEELVVGLKRTLAGGEGGVLLHVGGHALADGVAADGGVAEVGLSQPLVGGLELFVEVVVLGGEIQRGKKHNERSFVLL